ncbi:MAG: 50S ribosomal protein L18 [Candidatus Bathyarchaeota archaeon]|nr:50S ribosomal protein L18 [Candidatus Bathyarchaeota archaeon]
MARGPRYSLPFRRRREGKTNYRLRRRLIKSRRPRIVIRRSSKHVTAQLVEAEIIGDRVTAAAHSKELTRDYGWEAGCGNIPAAYLTGLLCGYRAHKKGIKQAVLDIGLYSTSKGSRVFAALKGFIDAGIEVAHDDKVLPDEARVEGQHITNHAARMAASDKDVYSRVFSRYLKAGLPPEEIHKHFSGVKDKIVSSFEK